MKKAHIKIGKRYTDNKGNVREVLAKGPEYLSYSGQAETDNLRYRVIAKKLGQHPVGAERNSTCASFATWAKAEVQQVINGGSRRGYER